MAKAIKSTIDITVGIYDTEYVFIDHGDYMTVTEPFVKWVNNSGSLATRKHKVTNEKELSVLRALIDADAYQIADSDGNTVCVDDIIGEQFTHPQYLPSAKDLEEYSA